MANVLGTLFGEIANAIRTKTGETGKMKPAEFAEKIESIEANDITLLEDVPIALDLSNGDQIVSAPEGFAVKSAVIAKPETLIPENIANGVNIAGVIGTYSGGGSGGGTLPAGLYLSASPIKNPTPYIHRRFMFNGELYATSANMAGSGYMNVVYKWDGNAWTTILTNTSTTAGVNNVKLDGTDWFAAEYNGEMHFFDNVTSTRHYVFDGEQFAESTELPYSYYRCTPVIYQNKMIMYSYSSGTLYEWDGSTWNAMAKISSNSYTDYFPFVVAGELYLSSSTTVYRYDDGVLTSIGTLPKSGSDWMVLNGKAYYADASNGNLYEYDPITNTTTTINMSMMSGARFSVNTGDLSACIYTSTSSNDRCPFFVFNIVESTE